MKSMDIWSYIVTVSKGMEKPRESLIWTSQHRIAKASLQSKMNIMRYS